MTGCCKFFGNLIFGEILEMSMEPGNHSLSLWISMGLCNIRAQQAPRIHIHWSPWGKRGFQMLLILSFGGWKLSRFGVCGLENVQILGLRKPVMPQVPDPRYCWRVCLYCVWLTCCPLTCNTPLLRLIFHLVPHVTVLVITAYQRYQCALTFLRHLLVLLLLLPKRSEVMLLHWSAGWPTTRLESLEMSGN